jgi:hypothetical protein
VDQEAQAVGAHLTPFGHGVCGFIAGAQVGAAIALTDPEIRLGDLRLTLFPILGGVACAVVAREIGGRLTAEARRGYDVCLAAVVCGAFATAVASLMGLSSAEALVCLGGCVALGVGSAIRRRVWWGQSLLGTAQKAQSPGNRRLSP